MAARITEAFRVEEVPGDIRDGRQCVRLLEQLEYRVGAADSHELITVPAGFKTDFASIPFGFRNLFPPLSLYARPAIVHDFLYATKGTGAYRLRRWINRAQDYTRKEADKIFKEAMTVVGVPAWQREAMYRAVRLGGGKGWGS